MRSARFFRKDIKTMSANIKRSITEEFSLVPLDLEAEIGSASAFDFAQKSLTSYGQLMCGWEELIEESRIMLQQAA